MCFSGVVQSASSVSCNSTVVECALTRCTGYSEISFDSQRNQINEYRVNCHFSHLPPWLLASCKMSVIGYKCFIFSISVVIDFVNFFYFFIIFSFLSIMCVCNLCSSVAVLVCVGQLCCV